MTRLARRMDGVETSGIRKIFDLVQNRTDAIDLSLGQPDFDVPPEIRDAATAAIVGGRNRYTVTQGLPELREKLARRLQDRFGWSGKGETLITAGCAGALFEAFLVLVDPGDEVLLPDPYFAVYSQLVQICGATAVYIDTYPDFRLRAEAVAKLITPKTKLLLLNTPSNPTGVALRDDEMAALAAVVRKHDLLVISDEIYEGYHFEGGHRSFARHYEKTLLVGGFSKTFGIPGWRLGFAAGPKEITDAMTKVQQFSFVCANAPAQHAALKMLDLDMSRYLDPYRKKRDLVYEGLKDLYDCVRPDGSFYFFPKCPGGDDQRFAKRAIESGVLLVPGSAFSRKGTHFRLCFAASDDKLKRAVDILRSIART